MKGKFSSMWRVALALVLVLSFSLVMPLPSVVSANPEKTLYVDVNAILDGTVASYNGTTLQLVATSANFTGYDAGDAIEFISGAANRKVTTIVSILTDNTTATLAADVGASANDTFNLVDLDAPSAGDAFKYIQSAITIATAGDTINVAAGTYDEQVVIGNALTLQGAGDTTIIKPSAASKLTSFYILGTQTGALWNAQKLASIISVAGVGTAGVTVKNLKVDGVNVGSLPSGADYIVGISFGETGGTIDAVTVVNMDTTTQEPRTYGVWLDAVATAVSVEVKGCDISLYNKNGINTRGAKLTVSIHDNTVTGPGNSPQVPNGIGLISGAKGTVGPNNVITHHEYTPGEWTACGIFTYDVAGVIIEGNTISASYTGVGLSGTPGVDGTKDTIVRGNTITGAKTGVQLEGQHTINNTITGNDIQDNEYGIYLEGPQSPDWESSYTGYQVGAGNVAHLNNITGNTEYGVANFNPDVMFDATNNWWGSVAGPSHGGNTFNVGAQGNSVSDNVVYVPWLNASYPTGTSFAPLNNTTQGTKFSSIQAAISPANPGDTITAAAGTYKERVTIGKPLTLKSVAGSDNTTIAPAAGDFAVTITSDNVTFGASGNLGFTITNTAGSGIKLAANNVKIDSNKITGNAADGIELSGNENRVLRNTISNNGNRGIHFLSNQIATWNQVEYNDITGNTNYGAFADMKTGNPYWMPYAGFNYWGNVSGPGGAGPGTGDKVNEYVWYNPWLNASYSTILASGIADISMAIPVEVGWNTLSTPLALAAGSIQWNDIVTRSSLTYDAAVVFNATTKEFENLSANSTMALNPLDTMLIKMSTDQKVSLKVSTSVNAPPTRPLKAGWNLVGAAMSITERELEMWKVLVSVDKTPAGLIGYNMVVSPPLATQPPWVYVRGQETATGFEWEKMDFGRGYWIYMENADEFAGFSSTPITARVWD